MSNPYLDGLNLVKQHSGTSGQIALAKCILSLYNPRHAFPIAEILEPAPSSGIDSHGTHMFSMGEILGPLDARYTKIVLAMIHEYARIGETEALREAGRWVYDHFPALVTLSDAMCEARADVRRQWDREREEENRRLYPNG